MLRGTDTETINAELVTGRDLISVLSSRNEAMRHCLELAQFAAKTMAPVMITGEIGVGKSLLAMIMHQASPRRARPCITFNCNRICPEDIRRQLFGDGDGQFGAMVRAKGGTIVIDAVDMLSSASQKELLTFFTDNRSKQLNVRMISTSGHELSQKAAKGLFLQELMYCLGEVTLRLPPLRERMEDLPHITGMALRRANQIRDRQIAGIAPSAMEMLARYDFPGNIRELNAIIFGAVGRAEQDVIFEEDLGLVIDPHAELAGESGAPPILPLREVERRHILRILNQTGWKIPTAATTLDISEETLREKITEYNLDGRSASDPV